MRKASVLAALLMTGSVASANTYTWNGGDGSSQNWSTDSNWVEGSAPVSASDTHLLFKGTNNMGTWGTPLAQDISEPFVLNKLEFQDHTAGGGGNVAVHLGGGTLHFVADGATGPVVHGNGRSPQMIINNDIRIDAGTTLTFKNSTYFIDLRGDVHGDGAVLFDASSASGELFLENANSYTGGTTYQHGGGAGAQWKNMVIKADGALGTGDLNIHGGNLNPYTSPSNERPGGVRFSNGSTTSNNINIMADSALFAADANGDTVVDDSITLSGTIDTNGHLTVLRGRGTGTATGTIDASEGSTLRKIDVGQWNLAGTMLFQVDGTSASLIDLDEGTLDISGLTLDFTGANATEESYVLVDYTTGGTLIAGSNDPFADILNLPTDYRITHDTVGQQVLLVAVPTPAAFPAALVGMGILVLRRKQRMN